MITAAAFRALTRRLPATLVGALLLWACAHAPVPSGTRDDDPARDDDRLRVVVMSDLNSGYGSIEYEPEVGHTVERAIHDWRPDLVLIAGDMIAGQRPALDDDHVRAMWAAFDSVVARPLRDAGIPLAFTLGNHDASGHPGHERDRRLAVEYWQDRHPDVRITDHGRYPFHYAFTMGDAFFLILDASTGGVVDDTAQMAWVSRALSSAEARGAGVRLSVGHVPLYAVAQGRNRPGEVQDRPDSLRAALELGDVRLHISGHHHAYYPGRRGDLELLHAGALGQGARPLLDTGAPPAQTVTLLDLFPALDSLMERTFHVQGSTFMRLDAGTLPDRIDGINGHVVRRDAGPHRHADLTVVSFNIRAGTDLEGRPSLDRVAALLDTLGADITLLQEVDRGTARSGGLDQLAELRRLTGMHGIFGPAIEFDGGEYGLGLLSRWPIADSAVVSLTARLPRDMVDETYEARIALHAVVAAPAGDLHLFNTHLNTGQGTYRRQELIGLMAEVHRRAGADGTVIVGGDFNATPDSDEIVAMTLFLNDAWAICGEGAGFTFPADDPVRRIDYLFLRAVGCTMAHLPATTVSDHRPVVVRIHVD